MATPHCPVCGRWNDPAGGPDAHSGGCPQQGTPYPGHGSMARTSIRHSYRAPIFTHYAGPTDTLGARIVATWPGERITIPYDHSMGPSENHDAAAIALVNRCKSLGKLDDSYSLVSAWTNDGYAYALLLGDES